MEIERRLHEEVEYRQEGDTRIVRGYGAVFGKIADIGYFTEEIRTGAFDSVMQEDVVFVFQHDNDKILARSTSGTLKYGVDARGLWYEASLPNTTVGNDMHELLKRGDITANSFAFGDVTDVTEKRNGKLHRTITKVGRLHDISLVTHPAYKDAIVVRSEYAKPKRPRVVIKKSELIKRYKY